MIPEILFIPLGTISSWLHNELRFALRSWDKYGSPIKQLLIIGHKPGWLQNVHHIPFMDRFSKPANIYEKVKIAAKHYDRFIFANDDHFLTKPLTELPYYYSGKLIDFKGGGDTFMRYVGNTWQLFPSGKYFDVHTPMVVEAQVVEQLTYIKDVLFKSLYCNTAGIKGEQFEDCKIRSHFRTDDILRYANNRPFISTDEAISVDTKRFLQETFPDKSRWEA